MKSNIIQTGLSASEQKMFAEISRIFYKYKNETREFGLSLLHSHFNVKRNEILHETNDKSNRTMQIRPIAHTNIPAQAHATLWSVSTITGKPKVLQLCCD